MSENWRKLIHAEKSPRKIVNINNNHNDEENQNGSQKYDIDYNVDDSMYVEQKESLSFDRHDDIEFCGATLTSGTGSRENRSFIKK